MNAKEAMEALKEALKDESSDTCTSITILINCQGMTITATHRTKEELEHDHISMRNIKGQFIN